MSGYKGQHPELIVTPTDGNEVFTEELRSRAQRALDGAVDLEIGGLLLKLSMQKLNPSHQATYYINELRKNGRYVPLLGYDEIVGRELQQNGDSPETVKANLAEQDISLEYLGD
jgi:hypothetical protein